MSLKYKHSTKTKSEWITLNPIIVNKEIVIEKDGVNTLFKVGDGTTFYNDLPYAISNTCITKMPSLNEETATMENLIAALKTAGLMSI